MATFVCNVYVKRQNTNLAYCLPLLLSTILAQLLSRLSAPFSLEFKMNEIFALAIFFLVLTYISGAFAQCYVNTDGEVCNGQGSCILNGTVCKCNDAYGNVNCTYKRKSQVGAFLLSFFLVGVVGQASDLNFLTSVIQGGWGAERFYLHRFGTAAGKLVLGIAACVLPCCLAIIGGGLGFKGKEGKSAAVTIGGTCLVLLLSLAIFAWVKKKKKS